MWTMSEIYVVYNDVAEASAYYPMYVVKCTMQCLVPSVSCKQYHEMVCCNIPLVTDSSAGHKFQ